MTNYEKQCHAIMRAVIRGLIDAGYSLSVDNGEEVTEPSTKEREVFDAMWQTDEDTLFAFRNGKRAGWVSLVYGNEAYELIANWTTNLDDALAKAIAKAESYDN